MEVVKLSINITKQLHDGSFSKEEVVIKRRLKKILIIYSCLS